MTTATLDFRIIAYGEVSHAVKLIEGNSRRIVFERSRLHKQPLRRQSHSDYWIAFSRELNDTFAKHFHQTATPKARLLVLNDCHSTDRLLSKIIHLQIRTPERVCVVDMQRGSGKTHVRLHLLLQRLSSLAKEIDDLQRILDAKIEDEVLHVVSLDFMRLDVPLAKIASLKHADKTTIQDFEIDPDGSFIYWPRLDVHLGWDQLQQIIDPVIAHKAQQRTAEFNTRYGKAVRKVREQAGLKLTAIKGISEKQLRRIERGECRLTSNAIETLSAAHKQTPNEYMERLAHALD